jgi:hypothetical protein
VGPLQVQAELWRRPVGAVHGLGDERARLFPPHPFVDERANGRRGDRVVEHRVRGPRLDQPAQDPHQAPVEGQQRAALGAGVVGDVGEDHLLEGGREAHQAEAAPSRLGEGADGAAHDRRALVPVEEAEGVPQGQHGLARAQVLGPAEPQGGEPGPAGGVHLEQGDAQARVGPPDLGGMGPSGVVDHAQVVGLEGDAPGREHEPALVDDHPRAVGGDVREAAGAVDAHEGGLGAGDDALDRLLGVLCSDAGGEGHEPEAHRGRADQRCAHQRPSGRANRAAS